MKTAVKILSASAANRLEDDIQETISNYIEKKPDHKLVDIKFSSSISHIGKGDDQYMTMYSAMIIFTVK